MKKYFFLGIIAAVSLLIQGCGDSNIDLVKNSNFPGYDTVTVGKMLDNVFEKVNWSSNENSKGELVVLFEGKISQKMHDSLKNSLFSFMTNDARHQTDDFFKTAMYTARHIPTLLGKDRVGNNFAQPLLDECREKYDYSLPGPSYIERIKSDVEKYRAKVAAIKRDPEAGILPWAEEDLAKAEREWAIIEQTQSPVWKAEKQECAEELIALSEEAVDTFYWAEGDTVFFEWKIRSGGKSFELSSFGGHTVPPINLAMFLEIIYEQ